MKYKQLGACSTVATNFFLGGRGMAQTMLFVKTSKWLAVEKILENLESSLAENHTSAAKT
ncbi:hypothetical protein, partial [Acinetobacter baumannii]|uniref:hypothetical protein n=1 Tax=Acinetobacter baumannii TaxID=470 RepID=UPI001C0692E6